MFLETSGMLVRRACWLLLGGMLLSPLTGCTGFQSIASDKWLEGRWLQGDPEQPVNHVLTIWDGSVRVAQDTVNGGASVHGLVGRLLLLNEETGRGMDALGTVMVCMHDMTDAPAGKEPIRIAEWKFDAKSLKQLKKTDKFGDGYTLFLPWDTYRSNIKQVHLQVCYVSEKGTKHYTEPVNLTLQTGDLPRSVLQTSILPVGHSQPQLAIMPPAPQQQVVPNSVQQQQPTPGTQVQYLPVPLEQQRPTSPLPVRP
jgi:hypothetical protein